MIHMIYNILPTQDSELNIWNFQNPNGSLHAIIFSCFPHIKLKVSHFLQPLLIIYVYIQLVSKKEPE